MQWEINKIDFDKIWKVWTQNLVSNKSLTKILKEALRP